jgi:hypothetical protein
VGSLKQLAHELIPFAEELVSIARAAGWSPRVTSVYRSSTKQRRLYAAFLRGETPYTVAPPGKSMHEKRIAFDLVLDSGPKDGLAQLGRIWREAGGTWGGTFNPPDPVHFDAR